MRRRKGVVGNSRKNPVSDDEIVESYSNSHSAYKVSRELGIDPKTVYRVLQLRGITRDGLQFYRENAAQFTMQQSQSIRDAYEDGSNYSALVSQFGGQEGSIKAAIKRAGGTLVAVTPALSDSEKQEVIALHLGGLSQTKIALRMDRSQSAIGRTLQGAGFIYEPLAGKNHPNWKGGVFRSGLYVRMKGDNNNPCLKGMLDDRGHVAQHRAVLAKSLGRPLTPNETVHHINGIKHDNRLENLQLRIGRHGRGVSMVCNDCGSHDISYQELET